MSWNNARETLRFMQEKRIFEAKAEEAGMSKQAIEQICQYDYKVFKNDRKYYRWTTPLPDGEEDQNPSEVIDTLLYHRSIYQDDQKEKFSAFDWLESIENKNLYRALIALNPDQLELIRLLIVEEKSQKEVAAVFGIQQGTVSKYLNEILSTLKASLE